MKNQIFLHSFPVNPAAKLCPVKNVLIRNYAFFLFPGFCISTSLQPPGKKAVFSAQVHCGSRFCFFVQENLQIPFSVQKSRDFIFLH